MYDPGMSEKSLVRFMLLQLYLRIYSVLSFPQIVFPAQLLTLYINFHHWEKRVQRRDEYGKIREHPMTSLRNKRWFQLMEKKWW